MSSIALRLGYAGILGLLPLLAQAEVHEVRVQDFAFVPDSLTIQAGDTVIWRHISGVHNVFEDNGTFSSGTPRSGGWTLERTFNQAGTVGYYCQLHGGPGGFGMSGTIAVQQAAPAFQINEGIQGSWFNPATDGQGILVEVSSSLNLFAIAWFTWIPGATNAGEYYWLTGAGAFSANRAELNLSRTRGGRFNDPTAVQRTPSGTAVFTFDSCTTGSVTFNMTDPPATGTIALQRILPAGASCTAANPGQ